MGYWQQGQGSTSRKRCTLTRPATEQTPEIPANEEAAKMTFLSSYDIQGLDIGDEELEKIVTLLLWLAKDFQSNLDDATILNAVLEVLGNNVDASPKCTAAIAQLSNLIGVMLMHKDGAFKNTHETLHFMRRVASIRAQVRADNATKRVELNEEEVSECYQRFGRELLTYDLLPRQKANWQYWLRNDFEGDTHLSGFQRSFTDNMLRKFLGDKKVAMAIWQNGLPRIANLAMLPKSNNPRVNSQRFGLGMLQSGLKECFHWYMSVASEIAVHKSQEGFDAQVSASSLARRERQRQQTRREALQIIGKSLRLGAYLAKQRDSKKRSFDEMNDDEQKTVEDYDTGITKRQKKKFTQQRMKPFRCPRASSWANGRYVTGHAT